jgi:hypothetical protein
MWFSPTFRYSRLFELSAHLKLNFHTKCKKATRSALGSSTALVNYTLKCKVHVVWPLTMGVWLLVQDFHLRKVGNYNYVLYYLAHERNFFQDHFQLSESTAGVQSVISYYNFNWHPSGMLQKCFFPRWTHKQQAREYKLETKECLLQAFLPPSLINFFLCCHVSEMRPVLGKSH